MKHVTAFVKFTSPLMSELGRSKRAFLQEVADHLRRGSNRTVEFVDGRLYSIPRYSVTREITFVDVFLVFVDGTSL